MYDAAGRRVAKEKYTGSNYTTFSKGTYYVYEAGGKVLATYEKTGEVMKLKEVPLLGSSRLGLDRVDATRSNVLLTQMSIYSRIVGSKSYELTDHLGNVRAVVNDIKLPSGMNFTADLNKDDFSLCSDRKSYNIMRANYLQYPVESSFPKVTWEEVFATNGENMIRYQLNLPLRTHYKTEKDYDPIRGDIYRGVGDELLYKT